MIDMSEMIEILELLVGPTEPDISLRTVIERLDEVNRNHRTISVRDGMLYIQERTE